ncbi:MAG: hypothetical protein ACLGHT_01750 [Acidimicrobiia bacterium]
MSDHEHELLARVKAEGHRRRQRRLGVFGAAMAVVILAGALGLASLPDDGGQQVRVAAPADQPDTTVRDATATTTTITEGITPTTSFGDASPPTTTAGPAGPSGPATTTPPETTTTTARAPLGAASVTDHPASGLTFELSTPKNRFRSAEKVEFTLVVRNKGSKTTTYNSSPGPRFAFLAADEQVWNDGCETGYPAIFTTAEIAPGASVTFTGSYPQTTDDPDARERCQQPAGDYALTGLFQWCSGPAEDPCSEGERIGISPIEVTIDP